jgi:hypothetical protein
VLEEKIVVQEGYGNQEKDEDGRSLSIHRKEKGKYTFEGERPLQPF